MNGELRALIEDRLTSEGVATTEWAGAVLAACDGRDVLDRFLETGTLEQTTTATEKFEGRCAGVFLSSLTVQGFRGIGAPKTVTFTPGPGLTLIVGRNGSGKSSFAEALEVLLTGDSRRWAGRPKVWRDGWRSLHQPHPARIEAELLVEGLGPTKITAAWEDGAPLEGRASIVQPRGKTKTSIDALGWTDALSSCRPFLSYNELGSTLDEGPSKLYDTLSSILGLDDLVLAQDALSKSRTERQHAFTQANQQRQALIELLEALLEERSDDRASACLAALRSKDWGLDALERLVSQRAGPGDDRNVRILQAATAIQVPKRDDVAAVAGALREADAALKKLAGTDADRSRTLAVLLESALLFHERHTSRDCPVCGTGGAIGETWEETTRQEIARLRKLATASEQAHQQAKAARTAALALLIEPPALLEQLAEIGLDGLDLAREVWATWHGGAALSDLVALADHLDAHYDAFAAAIENLKAVAAAELARREDRWRPIATAIAAWLPETQRARRGAEEQPRIKAAEEWLKAAVAEIRNARFAPIADRAMATWRFLRQNSNVELGRIELSGTKATRRVTLDVTVDGVAGAALGVMSQGELHSLALSLFLPRATLADSPFRFIVIDDPVQSMDPARVDGLAQALADVASTRQVIVFTHDDRLPDAVRRLQIPATMLSVTRRPQSVVEVRPALDPVRAHIEDAFALVHTTELPRDVLQRLVPGFCRAAVEASFIRIVRRRRLSAGRTHAEVEEELQGAGKLSALAALALFDDKERWADVGARLKNKFDREAEDVYHACRKGAHEPVDDDPHGLVKRTERLTGRLQDLR